MARVKSRNSKPELLVRRMLTDMGYRYRLHRADLPGKPDIAFIGRRKLIFVHGCFWHGHDCRRGAREPKANAAYWRRKIAANHMRDERHREALAAAGWAVLTIWECTLGDRAATAARLKDFLSDAPARAGNM
jgi:DNA mismatch endonuclease (patch repair protein)